nr:hypothetical protein BaRGS_024443 [Batillaria attramentaria]
MMDAMDAGSDNSNDIMDDGEEEEDIDEEMEAILYSQVHFACGDAMDGEPADEDCSFQPAKQISDYRAAFSKKGKTVKRKFDMEVELGIKKSNRDALSSPDTLTVKKNTTAKQFKAQFGSPQFISLLGSDSDDGKNSTKHSQKSPPLSRRQLNDLMGRSGMQKNRKEIVVIDSDDSSSTSSSESSASVTENSTMNDSSEADSDTDSEVMVISSGEGSRTRTPTLDLNWNVDAADRQTIQIVEDLNSQAQGEESKWMINDSDRQRALKMAVSRCQVEMSVSRLKVMG